MQVPGTHNTNAGPGQGIGCQVNRFVFLQVIEFQSRHKFLFLYLFFAQEILKYIRRVLQGLFNFYFSSFMLGSNVGDFPGQLCGELFPPPYPDTIGIIIGDGRGLGRGG